MTGPVVLVNCPPSIQRRAKRSMPTGIVAGLPGPGAAAMVKAAGEPYRIKSARGVANFPGPARSRLGLRFPRFGSAAFGSAVDTCRAAEPRHAIAMHGAPALPADFTHMPYANPEAPKGGRLVQGILGTFDSLNPLIVRGLAVQQVRGFVVESLMARGNDEAFTLYGLLARRVETDDSQELCHLPSRSQGALLRWQAGARRGRAVFVGPAPRQGPPQSSPVLLESRQG